MMQEFMQVKFGFNLLQSNQPQLVAYAISDSPVGLMAWMTQLMDPRRSARRFLDQLPDLLADRHRRVQHPPLLRKCPRPRRLGAQGQLRRARPRVAVFQDGDIAIRRYGEASNNIVRWTEYPHGGHYAAMTVPQDWLKDVREFFSELRR